MLSIVSRGRRRDIERGWRILLILNTCQSLTSSACLEKHDLSKTLFHDPLYLKTTCSNSYAKPHPHSLCIHSLMNCGSLPPHFLLSQRLWTNSDPSILGNFCGGCNYTFSNKAWTPPWNSHFNLVLHCILSLSPRLTSRVLFTSLVTSLPYLIILYIKKFLFKLLWFLFPDWI